MTTQKEISQLDNDWSELNEELLESGNQNPLNPQPGLGAEGISDSSENTKNSVVKKAGLSLRKQLLRSVLPIILLPLGIASVIGYTLTAQTAQKEALTKLKQHGLQVSETTDFFILDTIDTMKLIGAYPAVTSAAIKGNTLFSNSGLENKDIETLEKQFSQTKLLVSDASLNKYLASAVSQSRFLELFVTNAKGLNVAYSNPTSDFVQSDEKWWQEAQKNGVYIGASEFDDSANATVLPISISIKEPNSDTVLGVMKAGVSLEKLNASLGAVISQQLAKTEVVQIVNTRSGEVIDTISQKELSAEEGAELLGGDRVLEVGQILEEALNESPSSLNSFRLKISELPEVSDVQLENLGEGSFRTIYAQFRFQGRVFSVSTIPGTTLMTYASEANSEIESTSRSLLSVFFITAILLGGGSFAWLTFLSEKLSSPLKNLADKTQQIASAGAFHMRAAIEGTSETRFLAGGFNNLLGKVETLIETQKGLTAEQQAAREKLEHDIQNLLEEVGDAMDGDLTVRASLTSMEMSTVADLFNGIIDSLADIAVQVKQSSGQVSSALSTNETAIRELAEQSLEGTKDTKEVLKSVATMSTSIQKVAQNASDAAGITDEAYQSAQQGTAAMEKTVDGIVSLRSTVGETAKKMKRLGESSQKISQVVSLIEEIALKTNLLAINASVEASRAGEQGEGFAVVAEQVGALAEQSTAATKEIAQIVADIQAETNEVTDAMELGTSQVVDTTKMVETTKDSLLGLLEKSQKINQLMQDISLASESQADTSRTVTELMQRLTNVSVSQSETSMEIVNSMQTTAKVANELQRAVDQFKAEEDVWA